jgi:hypothetical protein
VMLGEIARLTDMSSLASIIGKFFLLLELNTFSRYVLSDVPDHAFLLKYLRPAVPPNYSSVGFDPSNLFLQASSAFKLFECGLRSLKSLSSGHQRLQIM